MRNRLARQLADAVGVPLDALESFLNLVNGILVRGKQAEGKIAVEIVRARIGHVQTVAGHFLGGFFGQAIHLAQQLVAQFEQPFVILGPLGFDFNFAVFLHLDRRVAEDGCGSG